MKKKKDINSGWVCGECGLRYGNRVPELATFHMDTCGVCGEYKSCTEPRDFGYLELDEENVVLQEGERFLLCKYNWDTKEMGEVGEIIEKVAKDNKIFIIYNVGNK